MTGTAPFFILPTGTGPGSNRTRTGTGPGLTWFNMVLPRTHRARTPRALTCIGKSIGSFSTPTPGVCMRAFGPSARNTEVADLRSEESDLQPTASHRHPSHPEHNPCPGTQIYTRMLPRRIGMGQLASQLHGRLHVQSKTVRYSFRYQTT